MFSRRRLPIGTAANLEKDFCRRADLQGHAIPAVAHQGEDQRLVARALAQQLKDAVVHFLRLPCEVAQRADLAK